MNPTEHASCKGASQLQLRTLLFDRIITKVPKPTALTDWEWTNVVRDITVVFYP